MAKAPKTKKMIGKKFSLIGLHTQLDNTVKRLQKEAKTKKRDKLIALVKTLRKNTPCPFQIMLVDLGA